MSSSRIIGYLKHLTPSLHSIYKLHLGFFELLLGERIDIFFSFFGGGLIPYLLKYSEKLNSMHIGRTTELSCPVWVLYIYILCIINHNFISLHWLLYTGCMPQNPVKVYRFPIINIYHSLLPFVSGALA